MEELTLSKLARLPEEKQKEVSDFVDFLLAQTAAKQAEKKVDFKKSGFGALKGTIFMAADFDEPLEDFKDYM